MAQEIFKRYEKKYILEEQQYLALMSRLVTKMTADDYGLHTISNIYFDTEDYELIRTSIEKPEYKEKLRLRCYGKAEEDGSVFVELKKKLDGVVYKRRVEMKLTDARKYLYYGIYPERDNQILREIDYTAGRYNLKPAASISYDRLAFFGKEDGELRVTFDHNIRCRNHTLDLSKGPFGTQLLEPGQMLMEVKIPGAMPMWMSRLFAELMIYPVSYSKYGTYYKEYLLYSSVLKKGGNACA